MKAPLRITSKPTSGSAGRLRMVNDWPERMEHVQPMLPFLAAHFVLNYVRAKLPRGSAYRAYRQGLDVARVRGDKGESAYAVHVDMKSRHIRKVRPRQVLLYVRHRQRLARPDPATEVLRKYNPWTFESLPFTPDPKFGYVQTKKVRPRTVTAITEKQRRQRPKWAKELTRTGHRTMSRAKQIKIPKSVSTLPNVGLEALKLEFGLGGAKPRPAWRIGVRRLIKSELRRLAKTPKYFVFPLTKPSDKVWKKWPPRTKRTIPQAQALKYVPFQRKLGIHA